MRQACLLLVLGSGLVSIGACISARGLTQDPAVPDVPAPQIAEPGDIRNSVVQEASYEEALVAALHHFAEEGEVGYARALLEKHPTIIGQPRLRPGLRKPSQDDDYHAIHRAAGSGRSRMVQLLLDKGEKVDADGRHGWTPVHVAAKRNRVEVLRVLDWAGADLNARTHYVPPQPVIGRFSGPEFGPATPPKSVLDIAREFRADAAIKYLESRGVTDP
jgi:hypothetical protein